MLIRIESRRALGPRWVTPLLVLACVLVYLALAWVAPAHRLALLLDWGSVPHTLLHPPAGPWWWVRGNALLHLLTALFIHADLPHLVGNMAFLLIFGLPVERALGAVWLLLLFVLGGMLANIAAALSLPHAVMPVIGASGAVSAIVGAYLALFPRAHLGVVLPLGAYLEFLRVPAALLIAAWILLQVAFSLYGPGFGAIAWWAHLAGFGLGLVCGLPLRAHARQRLRRAQ